MLLSKFLRTILTKFMIQMVMVTVAITRFLRRLDSWVKALWGKIGTCAANARGARAKRIKLLKFGLSNVNNFVWDPDKNIKPKLIQILPKGQLHIFGMNSSNLVTEQEKIDAFMATNGKSV